MVGAKAEQRKVVVAGRGWGNGVARCELKWGKVEDGAMSRKARANGASRLDFSHTVRGRKEARGHHFTGGDHERMNERGSKTAMIERLVA